MKASGRLISGSLRAAARIVSGVAAEAWAHPSGIQMEAAQTEAVDIFKYLRVQPEQPQELVWLVPQVGIDYTIESNTNWIVK